ncbi:hypothetical protein TUM3794_39890 [Shewanella colwelliana]|uniref:Uncharacterized protein n=1 Tax=Shewanella colwelliana TaxID=23 RepID=A0ABQ4PHZ6_SHECO|nr:hypothetical protein TUM3794_39890 [Shewanella colwelliana]
MWTLTGVELFEIAFLSSDVKQSKILLNILSLEIVSVHSNMAYRNVSIEFTASL